MGEGDDRSIEFKVSTAAIMHSGNRLDPAGWHLDVFRSNPVMLWAHDDNVLPIARAPQVWIEGDALRARAEFAPADLSPFADKVFNYYKRGFLHTVSAGWVPLKWAFVDTADRFGVDFLEQELVEFSAVAVPDNPEALIQRQAAPGEGENPPRSSSGLSAAEINALRQILGDALAAGEADPLPNLDPDPDPEDPSLPDEPAAARPDSFVALERERLALMRAH